MGGQQEMVDRWLVLIGLPENFTIWRPTLFPFHPAVLDLDHVSIP
jgi:hypothetical protein